MFLSAFSDPDTVAQVAALGAVAYMVKPLDVGQIVPTVEAAFERLRAQRAEAAALARARSLQPAAAVPAADVVSLAAEAVPILTTQELHDETLALIKLLAKAVETRAITRRLLTELRDALRQDPLAM